MKKPHDPYQMTLRQFLLFLVVGGSLLIFMTWKVIMYLHVGGEYVYMVRSYTGLDLALSLTENLYLPEKSVFPAHEDTTYYVRTNSTFRLTPVKDGYEIILSGDDSYSLLCGREDDPAFDNNLPLRADQSRHGTDLEVETTYAHVQVSFLRDGWFYRFYARPGDDETIDHAAALDTLLNITDNILRQAG